MSRAVLSYKDPKTEVQTILEVGSLFYIDQCTKNYNSLLDLLNSFIYKPKLVNYDNISTNNIELSYVLSNSRKDKLTVLVNDHESINKRDNYSENKKSEVERARKLLLNSKDKTFVKLFLDNSDFKETSNFNIRLSYSEYLFALKNNLDVKADDGRYYINMNDLLLFTINNKKYGILRPVIEDGLDIWKKDMMMLDEEKLYFYSRNLRVAINDYYRKIRGKEGIRNLNLRNENLINTFGEDNYAKITSIKGIVKMKKISWENWFFYFIYIQTNVRVLLYEW